MRKGFTPLRFQLRRGFTLIELLLVIGVIAVISGVVIVAIAPRKNFISARDAERKHSSKQLQQALYAHLVDEWELASGIEEGESNAKPICKAQYTGGDCPSNAIPLNMLPPSYISSLPVDVVMPETEKCTGYMVYHDVGRPKVYSANLGKLEGDAPEGGCEDTGGGGSDTITWSSVGGVGLNGMVGTLVAYDGDLYMGGGFTNAGGNENADRIAKWNGSSWSDAGITPGGDVSALEVYNGEMYAGVSIGGNSTEDRIIKWNGSSWSDVGGVGLNDGDYVYAFAVYNEELYVGGDLTNVAGNPNADKIAKWNGTSWSDVGGVGLNGNVLELFVYNGELYVGGSFTNVNGNENADRIAKWNGTSWSDVGGVGLNGTVQTFALYDGELYIGGAFTNAADDPDADYIARWNGTNWNDVAGTWFVPGNFYTLATHGGKLYAGGAFIGVNGDLNYNFIARWDGSSWDNVGIGLDGSPWSFGEYNGKLYVGGQFTNAADIAEADRIAEITVTP